MAYDNVKSHKKAEFHSLSRKHIFGKTTWGVSQLLSIKASTKDIKGINFCVYLILRLKKNIFSGYLILRFGGSKIFHRNLIWRFQ